MLQRLFGKEEPAGRFPWGGVMVTSQHARRNFLAVGVIGSGKSITLEMLMNVALGPPGRAIVFDATTDLVPKLLPRSSPGYPLWILHPFDKRCSAWDLAADLRTESEAQAFAEVLAPRADISSEGGLHYRASAINIIKAAIQAFSRRFEEEPRARWTFRDLVYVLERPQDLEALVSRYEDLALLIEQKGSRDTFKNTTATLVAYIGGFRPAAAGWHYADKTFGRRISIKAWAAGNGVLLLGHDAQNPHPLEVVNRLFVQRASGALLSRPSDQAERSDDLSWVFIDEAARKTDTATKSAPPIEGLVRLINEGRKFGVCVALGFQGIENFRAAYGGADTANSIIGMCRHLAVFNSTYETARWASEAFGAHDITKPELSESFGQQGSWSVTHRRFREPKVKPEDIMDLVPPDRGRPLTGYYQAPGYRNRRVFENSLPWSYIRQHLIDEDKDVPKFDPMPDVALRFPVWSQDERELFTGRASNVQQEGERKTHSRDFGLQDAPFQSQADRAGSARPLPSDRDELEPEHLPQPDIFRIQREREGL